MNYFFYFNYKQHIWGNFKPFRVLCDKIVSVYFIWKKHIYILALELASPGNKHCANCIGTLSLPIGSSEWYAYDGRV